MTALLRCDDGLAGLRHDAGPLAVAIDSAVGWGVFRRDRAAAPWAHAASVEQP